ncbi:adenylosuccinate lyase [Proteocatella sphenisci]|uniref:adenylosuccinate lyase n=1 Tax=Proteocatella sphenisci TaxID=181070 RepID=UPI00048A6036|nr:adenylosuccinate lyase [Proteocatella sphenisci]
MSNYYSKYQSPLNERYASKEMSYIFSDQNKFETFRSLWIALAESEKELGIDITDEQIDELKKYRTEIDFKTAKEIEKETRHDVMAHVKAYGLMAEKAKGIIHLGATSAFVGDNTDIIVMKSALEIIENKLAILINNLKEFSLEYKDMPALGFTHFQAAQLVTVGKRATLWMQDLVLDIDDVIYRKDNLRLRGAKGTTGTQASFMSLFDNDEEKVKKVDELVCEKMGFGKSFSVTGQTYTRKVDFQVLSALSQIAQSLHKMTNDVRLLQSLKEIEEPFEKTQIGSSAMAYKRNPMRSERISSLAKYVINIAQNPAFVHATQWLERTLDDSANKRLSTPEAFLATDAMLDIAINVTNGLVVYENIIKRRVNEELPFMATENILMEAVKKGGDRQELHEKIRLYSMEAGKNVKVHGLDNNLLELLSKDEEFKLTEKEIQDLLDPMLYIGRSSNQVVEFIENEVDPRLKKYENLKLNVELHV